MHLGNNRWICKFLFCYIIIIIRMLTAWRYLQLSLMTRHTRTSYYYYFIIIISSNLSDRWARAPKCPRHAEGVAALNCHGKTLTRNAVERGSWVTVASRRPISMMRWKACSTQVPDVSIAREIKSTPVVMSAYFCDFIASAVAATEPVRVLPERETRRTCLGKSLLLLLYTERTTQT